MGVVITGPAAYNYAMHCTVGGLTINKAADSIEGERLNISQAEAADIGREDPSLIWVEVDDAKSFSTWGELTLLDSVMKQ